MGEKSNTHLTDTRTLSKEEKDIIQLAYIGRIFDSTDLDEVRRQMLASFHDRTWYAWNVQSSFEADEKEKDIASISDISNLLTSRPLYSDLSHRDALHNCYKFAEKMKNSSQEKITYPSYSYDKDNEGNLKGPLHKKVITSSYSYADAKAKLQEALNCEPLMNSIYNRNEPFTASHYSKAKIAIFWDVENCPIPKEMSGKGLYRKAANALNRADLKGNIKFFTGFGNLSCLGHKTKDIRSSGVKLVHVKSNSNNPVDNRDLSDKKIIAQMYRWVAENIEPANIVLISSDIDYIDVLRTLKSKGGYNVVVVHQSVASTSTDLIAFVETGFMWSSFIMGGDPYKKKYNFVV